LPLHEIIARLSDRRSLPAGACAITFDDGWRDNAEYAVPELQRRGLAATIFVVTKRVGTPGAFWPDELCERQTSKPRRERQQLADHMGARSWGDPIDDLLAHLKRLPEIERGAAFEVLRNETEAPPARAAQLLDWKDLAEVGEGIDIEAHGATHALLPGLAPEQIEGELRSALETLRERGHGRYGLLAYPNGGHNLQVQDIARRVGFRAAVTTECGLAIASMNLMAIPRLALHDDVSRS